MRLLWFVVLVVFFVCGINCDPLCGVRVGEASNPGPLSQEQRDRVRELTDALDLGVAAADVDSFVGVWSLMWLV